MKAEELFLKCLAVNPLHVTALAFYGLYVQEVFLVYLVILSEELFLKCLAVNPF